MDGQDLAPAGPLKELGGPVHQEVSVVAAVEADDDAFPSHDAYSPTNAHPRTPGGAGTWCGGAPGNVGSGDGQIL
ncbi:hypothetical protein NicSoilC5_05400 [Arthrobacter sp. NicSoilC5]|nr:hypothetical protein NicSoilC5_05400 [Arthrobacter sp. NicSoilC5]